MGLDESMNGRHESERGMALVLALLAIVLVLAAVLLVSHQSEVASRHTEIALNQAELEEASKAGIDIGIQRIWNRYVTTNGNTTGNLSSYRVFIDTVVPAGGSADLVSPGSPVVLDEARGLSVTGLTMTREDTLFGIDITLVSTAAKTLPGGDVSDTFTAEQTVRVSGTPFTGFEYAVLATQLNCSLCHAGFRSVDQEYNTDKSLYNTFDRVKVATLEALLFRNGTADSHVAGTVYTRGSVYNENYTTMTDSNIASGSFKGRDFNRTNGKVIQNSGTGAMSSVNLTAAGTDSKGRPTQFASLYKNYPTEPERMTDGPLPSTFPAPYPDNNDDRHVDSDEFEEVASLLSGSLDGGIAYGVPEGGKYAGASLPTTSNGALSDLAGTGRYEGNLILVGTPQNPIQLDGEIAVTGDLVMKGTVKGVGQIFVKGNTYLVGDVTYADASNKFGVAADGTKNALSVITGGSVLMGDYLTIRGKNHTKVTDKFPDSTYSIDTRTKNKSASVTVKVGNKNYTETLNYGYFDPGAVDAGGIFSTMVDNSGKTVARQGQQFSFTQSELQLFNIYELNKAVADPDYTPRFYGLRESQPNNVYVYTKLSDEHAVKYDEAGNTVKLLSAYLTEKGYPVDILQRAAYHYMNPAGNWISEDKLRQIWYDDEMARPNNSKWKFDGLLYSNNAIFAITRSKTRHKSYTDGKLQVRGGIICPDLGVLAAGPDTAGVESFTVLYDKRIKEFWAPHDRTQAYFSRMVYRVLI